MERIPADLKRVLATTPKTQAAWKGLTPIAQRDFITWITSAKLPETRKRRVARVPDMLASGKRRPCCYAVVPMSLYTELGKNKKAQVAWKALTPDERRDFVAFVEAADDSESKGVRTAKVCVMLAAGKRHP